MRKHNVISRYDKTDNMSVVVLKRRHRKGVDTGANTELYIDGVKVKSAISFNHKINARGITIMTVKLIGHLKTR